MKTVGLIGLGAMGVLYSDLLQRGLMQGDFFVIADAERVERYQRDGVYCNGTRCDFLYRSKEDAVPVDLLIVGVKFGGLKAAIEEAAPFVTAQTVISAGKGAVLHCTGYGRCKDWQSGQLCQ